jgi:hypothetical protein
MCYGAYRNYLTTEENLPRRGCRFVDLVRNARFALLGATLREMGSRLTGQLYPGICFLQSG